MTFACSGGLHLYAHASPIRHSHISIFLHFYISIFLYSFSVGVGSKLGNWMTFTSTTTGVWLVLVDNWPCYMTEYFYFCVSVFLYFYISIMLCFHTSTCLCSHIPTSLHDLCSPRCSSTHTLIRGNLTLLCNYIFLFFYISIFLYIFLIPTFWFVICR